MCIQGGRGELGVKRLSDICLWKCEAVGTDPSCTTRDTRLFLQPFRRSLPGYTKRQHKHAGPADDIQTLDDHAMTRSGEIRPQRERS